MAIVFTPNTITRRGRARAAAQNTPLTRHHARGLLKPSAVQEPSDRDLLVALLAALEDPRLASSLPRGERTVAVARHHRLSPLLSAVCGELLPGQLAEPFRHDRVLTVARNLLLAQVGEECVRAFADVGIHTILLKGLDYERRLYDSPGAGARATSDVDLFVHAVARKRAFEILDRLGFEPRAAAPGFDDPDYHEVAWTRRGVEVDLHLALAPLARCRIDYQAIWAAMQPMPLGKATAGVLIPEHAALFQALHMAIDHFDVPGIYLVDLARLLDRTSTDLMPIAHAWRCRRPLETAIALAAAFLPRWAAGRRPAPPTSAVARHVARRFGPITPLPRAEQLARKLLHFDRPRDALRYVAVQSRRNLREQIERKLHRRSARERLAL
jgi:hypothetical protein